MPTMMSHIAIPLALKMGLQGTEMSRRLLLLAMFCSILPDFDVVAFSMGIPYESQWGHRGFTHSFFFAGMLALFVTAFSRRLACHPMVVFGVIFLSTASHALLDAATNGGLGCALFWPFTDERYFLPWTPIAVSPIGIKNFLSERGAVVLLSEFYWVWLPVMGSGLVMYAATVLRLRMKNVVQKASDADAGSI